VALWKTVRERPSTEPFQSDRSVLFKGFASAAFEFTKGPAMSARQV
jgi:hypothetical protein